jgi:hypothetical protein
MVYLFSKGMGYFSDREAVKEPAQDWGARDRTNGKYHNEGSGLQPHSGLGDSDNAATGRNPRSVQAFQASPFQGGHYATFPVSLPMWCIRAATSEHGVCAMCGAPWVRVVERTNAVIELSDRAKALRADGLVTQSNGTQVAPATSRTIGFRATCSCTAEPAPSTVLDPFSGSGTTGIAALAMGRSYIGIELSQEYLAMSQKRIAAEVPDYRKEHQQEIGRRSQAVMSL